MIKMFWCIEEGKPNIGDALNPVLMEKMTGDKVEFADKAPRLFACGTILDHMTDGDYVWGSGVAEADRQSLLKGRNPYVFAVRGPLTRNTLIGAGIRCEPVYGDPAVLLPKFFPRKKIQKYEFGIIPHYVDLETVRNGLINTGIGIISPFRGLESFIDELMLYEKIISSSLHGIIIAEAYGIPAVWAGFSHNRIRSPWFKYMDYYLSTCRSPRMLDMTNLYFGDLNKIKVPDVPSLDVLRENLMVSFERMKTCGFP